MAGHTDSTFSPYLSNTQQDLLLAALTSNQSKNKNNSYSNSQPSSNRASLDLQRPNQSFAPGATNGTMFASPLQVPGSGNFSSVDDFDNTPYLDYLDGDASFDMDEQDFTGQQMIGALPGDSSENLNGSHDKRKITDSEEDDEEGDHKRGEGDDKSAKKPGRKPLTSEPTTKRKAQNRAAQRAFRERKERHLKDLETKVNELAKVSERDKQENSILKAQIQRLNSELSDYRKRMSSDANRNRTPPAAAIASNYGSGNVSNGNDANANNFSFDFPTFGNLPGSQLFGQVQPKVEKTASPPMSSLQSFTQQNSSGTSLSPRNRTSGSMHNLNSSGSNELSTANVGNLQSDTSQLPSASIDSFAGLFSPGLLNGAGYGTIDNEYGFPKTTASPPAIDPQRDAGTDSNSGLSRVFRFNSGSTSSNTDSPSASSASQYQATSSCGTSPEPSHPSPTHNGNHNKGAATNSVPALSNTNSVNSLSTPSSVLGGFDWLSSQNGGQFDPVLFGDYRDTQEAIVGGGDFNNGFFNDAFPYDVGSPFNFDFSSPKLQQSQLPQQTQQPTDQFRQAPQIKPISASDKFLAEVEAARNGGDDDYGLPTTSAATKLQQQQEAQQKMLNCSTIWNQLQTNKDFQDGKFDLDGLCSELRKKAKCSESGVVVPEHYVAEAFNKLSNKTEGVATHEVMFDQSHVDDALKRLGGGNWPTLPQM